MDLFWQINPEEMLSGLMVATFVILLDTAIVVVCSMVTFPLIDRRRLSLLLLTLKLGTLAA